MQQVQCHVQIKINNHSQINVGKKNKTTTTTQNSPDSHWPSVREHFHGTTATLSHHRSLSLCSFPDSAWSQANTSLTMPSIVIAEKSLKTISCVQTGK